MAMPSRSSGPGQQATAVAVPGPRRSPVLRSVVHRASAAGHRDEGVGEDEQQDEPAAPIATDLPGHPALHQAPDDERRGQGAGAERHVQEVHRPAAALAIDVEHQAVRATVQATRTEGGDHRRGHERAPRWGETQSGDPESVDEDAAAQDEPTAHAFGQGSAAERPGRVRDAVREVDEADAGIGLVERGLDRPDERRDEQTGPADREERQAPDDAGGQAASGGHRVGRDMRDRATPGWAMTAESASRPALIWARCTDQRPRDQEATTMTISTFAAPAHLGRPVPSPALRLRPGPVQHRAGGDRRPPTRGSRRDRRDDRPPGRPRRDRGSAARAPGHRRAGGHRRVRLPAGAAPVLCRRRVPRRVQLRRHRLDRARRRRRGAPSRSCPGDEDRASASGLIGLAVGIAAVLLPV